MRSAMLLAVLGLGLVVASCGSDKRDAFDPNAAGNGASSGGAGNGGQFDQTDAGDGAVPAAPVIGWLQGKVVAPEGTVPIRGALLYLTKTLPDAIPDGVHCDTCVHLTPLEPYTYSKSDGTFDLPAYATGKQWLVVQKGQFRRVREVDVASGDQKVASDVTRLPSRTDVALHDTIPKIGMVVGGFDHIDFTMKKLGIEEFFRYGDGPFDVGGTPPGTKTGKTGKALMDDASELGKHHIVLLPCAALGYTNSGDGLKNTCGAPQGATKTALAQFVDAGGKLYVTDYAYESVRQTWPGFITWYDDTMQPMTSLSQKQGEACRGGAEDTPGNAKDPGLDDWLKTIGHPSIELRAAWSRIASVSPQPGFDPSGKPVTITPKVWMTSNTGAGELPATVSFEQKCGRVLFSTYHCEGDDSSQLLAQEKALLYILLEVGVCVGELPPPPPPR
jgi:hypothetical protein